MEEEFERQTTTPTTPTTPTTTERRKRVLSFRVNDPTPVVHTRTPDLAIQLGVVYHRPFSIWEWSGPTDRMQVTLVLVPHRTSTESFVDCVRAASNRFYLNPEKYCFSDVFDVLYEDGLMTNTYGIADPRISNEVLVFYVPRVYIRRLNEEQQQPRPTIHDIVTHLKTVCVKR